MSRRSDYPECPCGNSNKDGKYLVFPNKVGYCHSCSKTFYLPGASVDASKRITEPRESNFVPAEIVRASLTWFEHNPLIQYLIGKHGKERVMESANDFFIGTTKDKSTLFWYIDKHGCPRKGKSILFKADGHRTEIQKFVGDYNNENGYFGCLFGEHLMFKNPNIKNISLVESEKSAFVAWMYFKDSLWLATSGATGLTDEKRFALKGYSIAIYPDCDEPGRNNADKWVEKLKGFEVSAVIHDLDPSRNDGADIADFIDESVGKKEATNYPKAVNDILAIVNKMKDKYPNVKDLVERLGLEVVNISKH